MKGSKIWLGLFGVLGVGILLMSARQLYSTVYFQSLALRAEGQVTELVHEKSRDGTAYYPVVRFFDGRSYITFRSNAGTNPPAFAVDEKVRVLFDPRDPSNAKIQSFFSMWGGVLVTFLVGSMFTVVSFGSLAFDSYQAKRIAWLQENGQRIQAQITGVERNTSFSKNRRCSWRVVAQWQNPVTGNIHLFYSEKIWYNPEAYLSSKSVNVLVEAGNPAQYWMDTSFLPKLEPDFIIRFGVQGRRKGS